MLLPRGSRAMYMHAGRASAGGLIARETRPAATRVGRRQCIVMLPCCVTPDRCQSQVAVMREKVHAPEPADGSQFVEGQLGWWGGPTDKPLQRQISVLPNSTEAILPTNKVM